MKAYRKNNSVWGQMSPWTCKHFKPLFTWSSLNTDQNNYDDIQFVQYGLAQVAGERVYKQQIVNQNTFLHNLAIIPVHNIDSDTMDSDIIPMSRKMGQSKDLNQRSYQTKEENGSLSQ